MDFSRTRSEPTTQMCPNRVGADHRISQTIFRSLTTVRRDDHDHASSGNCFFYGRSLPLLPTANPSNSTANHKFVALVKGGD